MATTTTRLALSKPASGDLVSLFQGTVDTSFDTIDANFAFNVSKKVGPYTAVAGDFILADVSGRSVSDAVTNGTAVVTSATAAFVAGDVGRPISGTNIPATTYVGVINSATSIGLSSSPIANTPVNASGSGSGGSLAIGASWSLTLPASPFNGAAVGVKLNVAPGGNTLTVVGTVDGASNPTLTALNSCRVFTYDGTAWQISSSWLAGLASAPIAAGSPTSIDELLITLGFATETENFSLALGNGALLTTGTLGAGASTLGATTVTTLGTGTINAEGLATAGTLGYKTNVTGDTNDRFTLGADGTLSWGSGSAAADLTFARTAANQFTVTGTAAAATLMSINAPAAQDSIVQLSAASGHNDRIYLHNGATANWQIIGTSGGNMQFYNEVNGPIPLTLNGGATASMTLADPCNIVLGTTTGTKIGTATTQKLGLYNATPVVQAGAITAPAATGSTNVAPYGYTQAQADALITAVRAILVAIGAGAGGIGITA